jgi:hypothetical protein
VLKGVLALPHQGRDREKWKANLILERRGQELGEARGKSRGNIRGIQDCIITNSKNENLLKMESIIQICSENVHC